MGFYNLEQSERVRIVNSISADIRSGFAESDTDKILSFFSDQDTYIRKTAYLAVGRWFFAVESLRPQIIKQLQQFSVLPDFRIRQTAVNAAGEIGRKDFERVSLFFDSGLFDPHHAVRNAVIGSIKKMGAVNPGPVLNWARKYLHHHDPEIRREICHGIELRGREHPNEILPLLKQLQFDKKPRVKNTLIHVIGQIAYKKGCLPIVADDLKSWENQQLVQKALREIIDVHDRYRSFAALTQDEAIKYLEEKFDTFRWNAEVKNEYTIVQ